MSTAPRPAPSLARNIGWFGIAQVWSLGLSIASALILARLLLPTDYAIMAVIVPLVTTAQFLQTLGAPSAIAQAKQIDQRQIDALFWLVLSIAAVLASLLAFAGPPFAKWLTGLDLRAEMAFASLALIASALSLVPSAMLQRSLQFRTLAFRNIIATTVGFGVAIGLAIVLRNYWALLAGPVLVPTVNFFLAAAVVGWIPSRPRRVSGLGPILGFGVKLWLAGLINFASRSSDSLIIAGAASPYQLGLYNRSYSVLLYPMNQAVQPLGQVLIPTLVSAVDDPLRYRMHYWRSVMLLLSGCVPALLVVIVFPTTLIGLLLGPNWLEAARMFGWFAAAGLVEMVLAVLNWLLSSQRRGGDVLRSGLVGSAIMLTSFVVGIGWGIEGVAIAFTLGRGLLHLPLMIWLTGRCGPLGAGDLLVGLAPHAAASLTSGAALVAMRLAFGLPLWPLLIAEVVLAYAVYTATLIALPSSRALILGLVTRAIDWLPIKRRGSLR